MILNKEIISEFEKSKQNRKVIKFKMSTEQKMKVLAQVPAQLDNLGHAVELLQENIKALEDRLNSVLSDPKPEVNEEEETKDREQLVPMAETIISIESRVEEVNHQIRQILARLEL